MSEDYAEFRRKVISYFRWNVYDQDTEFLEWIPRNQARILNLMAEEFERSSSK